MIEIRKQENGRWEWIRGMICSSLEFDSADAACHNAWGMFPQAPALIFLGGPS